MTLAQLVIDALAVIGAIGVGYFVFQIIGAIVVIGLFSKLK